MMVCPDSSYQDKMQRKKPQAMPCRKQTNNKTTISRVLDNCHPSEELEMHLKGTIL
jgi:hypothetical protein